MPTKPIPKIEDDSINCESIDLGPLAAQLPDSQQRVSLALEAADVGVWDLDMRGNTVWRSLRHDQIFGHDTLLPR